MKEYDFYIVPMPIGNLKDITLRALEVLNYVDIIACEDSRVTQKLLNHYNIKTKCVSYHKYNEKERVNFFIKLLSEGKKFALVSDAGTPLICDPGAVIVEELRNKGYKITSLAGANAVVTFLSQLSREDEQFNFVGFLPKSQAQIQKIVSDNRYNNLVFYESPNRIIKTLEVIAQIRPEAKAAFGRELTKVFEEVMVGKISELTEHLKNSTVKGEFVCMIFADKKSDENCDIEDKIQRLKDNGYSAKDISLILSLLFGVNKNEVYKACR